MIFMIKTKRITFDGEDFEIREITAAECFDLISYLGPTLEKGAKIPDVAAALKKLLPNCIVSKQPFETMSARALFACFKAFNEVNEDFLLTSLLPVLKNPAKELGLEAVFSVEILQKNSPDQ